MMHRLISFGRWPAHHLTVARRVDSRVARRAVSRVARRAVSRVARRAVLELVRNQGRPAVHKAAGRPAVVSRVAAAEELRLLGRRPQGLVAVVARLRSLIQVAVAVVGRLRSLIQVAVAVVGRLRSLIQVAVVARLRSLIQVAVALEVVRQHRPAQHQQVRRPAATRPLGRLPLAQPLVRASQPRPSRASLSGSRWMCLPCGPCG